MQLGDDQRHRRDIDGLRAIAVLAVLAFHGFKQVAPWGFIGVDVFFVISGYLITTILLEGMREGTFSFTRFYVRRIRRIFPALLVVLGAVLLAGWLFFLPEDFARLGRHVAAGGAFFSNLLLWSESGYFRTSAESTPLLHLWSLGIEEQFYIAWPLLLWLVRGRPRATVALCAGLGLASFAFGWMIVSTHPESAFFSPLTRIWELLAGAWFAQRVLRGAGLPGSDDVRSLVACALFLVSAFTINEDRQFPGGWALLPVAATVLWISSPASRFNRAVLGSGALVRIGLISYPLYLWHWPLLAFVQIAYGQDAPAGTRTGALALSFLFAWATVQTAERWLRFGGYARAKAGAMVGMMAVLVALGWAVSWFRGVPERFPAAVRTLGSGVEAHREWHVGACFLSSFNPPSTFDLCPDKYRPGTTVIWGDSHAAALTPGLRRLLGEGMVVQRTAGSCQPLVHVDKEGHPNCRGNNDRVLREIREHHPDVVILAANWLDRETSSAVRGTIAELREAGIRRVILVGPMPKWSEELPRLVFRAFREDPAHRVPWRLLDKRMEWKIELDAYLEGLAREMQVAFVSPRRVLCDPSGCVVRVGDEPGDLVTWDRNHLSVKGSGLMAAELKRAIP